MPQGGVWTSPDEVNCTVRYQFKTYIRAPPVDNWIRRQIRQPSDSARYDMVWVSSGEWGSFVRDGDAETTSYDLAVTFLKELAGYYKGWIVVSGDSSYLESCAMFLKAARDLTATHGSRFLVLDEAHLARAAADKKMVEGHGHLGTTADTFTRVVFAAMCGS
jgi:hypothetical protein